MIDEDVASYLQDTGSTGTIGTNIFIGLMPYTPDACQVITMTAGQPPHKTTQMEVGGFQVKVRATTYDAAQSKITTIYYKLHRLTNTTINARVYYRIEAQGSPMFLGRDENNRCIFSQNYVAYKIIESS